MCCDILAYERTKIVNNLVIRSIQKVKFTNLIMLLLRLQVFFMVNVDKVY